MSAKSTGLAVLAVLIVAAAAYFWWSRAHLSVTSVPVGAEVRVDGRLLGHTPLRRRTLPPGLHLVEVSHSYYSPYRRQLRLPSGKTTSLELELERGVGTLMVYSNPRGAWVEVDGRRREGTTPLLVKLPSGPHEVVMGMEERRAATAQVTVRADETGELRLDLNIDPYGSLTVNTVPEDARVSLPGSDVDYRPGVRLPLGEYPVLVTRAGYESRERRLEIRYGDNRYSMELPRAFAALDVRITPSDARVRVRYRQSSRSALSWRDYQPGMRLPVGEVEVRASALGRRSAYRHLDLPPDGAVVTLSLERMQVRAGEHLHDALKHGGSAPEVVVVPPGSFVMGSTSGAAGEQPARHIDLNEPFAIGVTEVTVADYRRFADATGRSMDDRDADDALPVTHVSFADASAYAEWLSSETGERYRLPSEAEWEYMARAGSDAAYFYGDDAQALCHYGNVADVSLRRRQHTGYDLADCDDGFAELAPVGSFAANAFGIEDVLGNVAEWVMECGLPAYENVPDDGAPVDAAVTCPTHGVRGGSWSDGVSAVRSTRRSLASSASGSRGIRVLREL